MPPCAPLCLAGQAVSSPAEGVAQPCECRSVGCVVVDRDDVDAQGQSGMLGVPHQVMSQGSSDAALLTPGHAFRCRAEITAATVAHLDDDELVRVERDEIELAEPAPVATLENDEPVLDQIGFRDPLPVLTEAERIARHP